MKNLKCFSFLILLVACSAFAADATVNPEFPVKGFEWVGTLIVVTMQALASIPAVGAWLVPVVEVIGIVTGILTVLVVAVGACFKIPALAAKWAGASEAAAKIEKVWGYIFPWLAFLSAFNVQKKPEEKK